MLSMDVRATSVMSDVDVKRSALELDRSVCLPLKTLALRRVNQRYAGPLTNARAEFDADLRGFVEGVL